MEKPLTKMTNYFKMRILLFKTYEHRQKRLILASVVLCAQSKALISLQVLFSDSAKLRQEFSSTFRPNNSKCFLLTVVFFLQLPQSTRKIWSSDNKRNKYSVPLLREHSSGKPMPQEWWYPRYSRKQCQVWMLTLPWWLRRRRGDKVALSCCLFMLSCCSARCLE